MTLVTLWTLVAGEGSPRAAKGDIAPIPPHKCHKRHKRQRQEKTSVNRHEKDMTLQEPMTLPSVISGPPEANRGEQADPKRHPSVTIRGRRTLEEYGPHPIADTWNEYIKRHAGEDSPAGDFARETQRDPCWPLGHEAQPVDTKNHLQTVHGLSDLSPVMDAHEALFQKWMEDWSKHGGFPGRCPCNNFAWPPLGYPYQSKFPPREDILAVAREVGMRFKSTYLVWCFNDDTSQPDCGHWRGNRQPSMTLYPHDNHFYCHQCGINGWSDQLRTKTWVSKTR